jgi:hypothetical protein
LPATGTITLASTITNSVNLTLDGTGHALTISGNQAVRVLYVNTNVTLNLLSLTIANGWATNGGGLLNQGGTVNITNCTFVFNAVSNYFAYAMQQQSSVRRW